MHGILVPISFFAMILGLVLGFQYLKSRNKERMALIEKGVDASIFAPVKKKNNINSLKYGLFFIGIAAGILFGNILYESTILIKEVAYFSMIFLFGGISLIISFFAEKKLIA